MNVMLMTTMGMKIMLLVMVRLWAYLELNFLRFWVLSSNIIFMVFIFFFPEFSVSLVVDKIDIYSVFLC